MGDEDRKERGLALALEALAAGRAEEALQLLQLAASLNPNNVAAHRALGQAHAMRGDLPLAVAAYRRALQIEPDHVAALCALGKLLLQRQETADARQAFDAALRIDPQCAEAKAALASLPDPSERFVIALQSMAVARNAPVATPYTPGRLALVVVCLCLFLVGTLAFALLQARKLAGERDPTAVSDAGATGARGTGMPPGAGTSGTTAPREDGSAPQAPADVRALLHRMRDAEERHREQLGTYASLSGLAGAGLVDRDLASGEPLPAHANAILSDCCLSKTEFRVIATLPDGTAFAIDQRGEVYVP